MEIKFARETGKYAQEKPPTNNELKRILDAADIRHKVAISLMAFTGFRDQTLGNYKGVDGLKIADFPEMTLNDGRVEFRKTPTIVRCRSPVSKVGYEYQSLLNEEGCEYLKAYLEDRMRPKARKVKREGRWIQEQVQGEALIPNSPIVTPKQLEIGSHIRTTNIGDIIRKAIVKAGFRWRPYVCRRYFATRMLRAEDDRLITTQYTKFWMGHMGEILLRYTLGKGLDPDDLERMRNAYQRVDEAHLSTRGRKEIPQDKIVSTLRNEWLRMAGYTDEDVAKLGDLSALTQEKIQELVRQKTAQLIDLSGKGRQKVVSMTELSQVLGEGWEFVTTIPNNQAIVRLPF